MTMDCGGVLARRARYSRFRGRVKNRRVLSTSPREVGVCLPRWGGAKRATHRMPRNQGGCERKYSAPLLIAPLTICCTKLYNITIWPFLALDLETARRLLEGGANTNE